MIKIEISINGDGEATEPQARAVVAALVQFYGPGIIPAHMDPPTTITKAPPEIGPDTRPNIEIRQHEEALAPDGHPVPAAPTPAGEVERDSEGIPWDERIHAGTKTKVAAGTWTRRRNTPDDVFNSVMAELRAANTARTMEAAQALTTPPTTPAPEPTAAEAFTPPASVVIPPAPAATPAPPPPAVPAAPAPAPTTGGDGPSFPEIMKKLTAAQGAGLLPNGYNHILADVGLGGMAELIKAPAHIRAAVDALIPVPA